jgi:MarR family transcriptional regulator, negative regulator of the multidrug operon emrRAB
MSDELRTANLLGATVLGLFDELRTVVERQTGRSGESGAALVVLGHQPGLSNEALSRLLGLTHTGSVRLIDRLVIDGLVERRASKADRRGVALFLTSVGEAVRREVLAERETLMTSLTRRLAPDEQARLADLLAKLLQGVARDDTHKLRICRLCDGDACGNCPIHVPVGVGDHADEKET